MMTSKRVMNLEPGFKNSSGSPPPSTAEIKRDFLIPAPKESRIEMFSPAYFAASAAGGLVSCGVTHTAVTPLDVVKCNMQIDPAKYKSVSSGFGILLKEQGIKGFFKGWAPTLLGYSAQGAFKYGLYEYFKKYYSDIAGPEYAAKYKTLIYLAGSASAEIIADVALCPFEAVKVRVQTQPGFARGLADGLPKIIRAEGLGVSFSGGYIAGVFCAIISHPADNLVSFLNNAKGATVADAVNKLGLWGLCTRGLPLRIFMIGTLTGAQWGIYDASKVFFGLPTTGGGIPAPAPK
ncbi:hypothetical protein DH2020_013538 [Rehmannia glutinosa]|uniref:Mitochondrial phosphate carrier protein n=1 Tax=Rehmannia glutinosa TaxID=99300 RepID=A0ABR0X5P5_REHGL